MNPIFMIVTGATKLFLELTCKIDKDEFAKIPQTGPLICYINHTGSVEVPIFYTQILPRKVSGLAKAETWNNPFGAFIFNLWGAIPIRRGEADTEAMRALLAKLEEEYILGIAPEGTRNRTGQLLRAHPGTVVLALRSGAALLPLAHWGGEDYRYNLKHLKRTDFQVRTGKIFHLDPRGEKVNKEVRQVMVDEMMYQLAKLLPEKYRGEYSDIENATEKYLRFDNP
jgi:1-acyl-sn-glycerol-3-phosphate acyltransferase